MRLFQRKLTRTPVKKTQDRLALLFFLGPSLAGFSVFYLIPFAGGIYYSLVDSPIAGSFVGIANYIQLLKNPIFIKAGLNTLIFTGISVPLNIAVSLGLALMLKGRVYIRTALRTAFIIPLVIPVASVVMVWQIVFDARGFLNGWLEIMGISTVAWMKTEWARGVIILVYLWKNAGYSMVVYIAGLQNIPVEYYESADIDGAGGWRKFRCITLTYLTPASFFVFIMAVINSFKVFRETYLVAGPYPQDGIYMLQHYMNNMFMALDYQKLTSAAFILALLLFLLIAVLFGAQRKAEEHLY